ncbi:MAG: PqqD family protein [Chloroflexi bacterium]|nr:PqqD family protein [Chloroflexota bacterium]MBI3733220.1 PqqD family protein [Chloroflexota bacterium]
MSEAITLDTVIARRTDLLSAELSDTELVMLNVERGSYYGVVETAQAIWSYLDEPRSSAAVCAHLLTRFAVDRETCEREVLAFVNELLKDDLVRVVGG